MAGEPILGNADQDELQKCKEEITAVLQRYDCFFEIGMLLRPGKFPEPIMKIARKPKVVIPSMGINPNFGGMMPPGKA